MPYSISSRIFFPSMCARPARVVRAKLASIAWAAALVAVGLDTTAVTRDDGHAAAVTALRGTTDVLAIGASTKGLAASKAGRDLLVLHGEYRNYLRNYLQTSDAHARGPSGFTSRNPLVARIAEGYVIVNTTAEDDPEALASDLEALGLEDPAVFGRMVSGRLPLAAIPALENLGSLRFARAAYAMTLAGIVTSQGDTAMRADIARSTFGVNGTGVTVGVLSDSFNCLGGAAAGVASGDLPAGITVLREGPCAQGLTDETRALAEVIHDVAPGAAIAVHSAFNGQANFAQGIVDLANAGARVITDDVIYFAEPMFQDGPIAQAVDQVKALGVSYFSAAGNQARTSYESQFRPSGTSFNIGFGLEEAHDFDPGPGVDTCQQITLPGGGQTSAVSFQWDQPFASASVGAPGSQSDLDIVLTDAACNNLNINSADPNVGRDPVEVFGVINNGQTAAVGLRILRRSGPNPGLMKTVLFGSSSLTINEFGTRSGASFGHSVARGGLGVGAADYRRTPAFGQNPPLIETFSSAGGTLILFDTAGNRLATPEIRAQPAISAPDGADTTFFGGRDPDGTGFPNFFGTSASAPHAAGVAALMKELVSSLTPDATYAALKNTAIDMDDPATGGFDTGFDFGTGFGLIQADTALGQVAPPPPPPPPQPPPPPPPPPPPAIPPPGFRPVSTCQARTCGIPLTCQDTSTVCTSQVNITVRASALKLGSGPGASAKAQKRVTIAADVVNVPPGRTDTFQLPFTKNGRKIVKKKNVKRLKGRLEVSNVSGAMVSNTPITIRLITIRPR